MKAAKIAIYITLPIFLLMFFASLLTTTPYLLVSEGLYESHEDIEFDHSVVSDRVMGYLNYRYDDLQIYEDGEPIFRDIEIRHMIDVKNLYTALRLVALGSLFIAISCGYYLYKKDKRFLLDTLKNLYVGPAVFIMVLGGYILIDFSAAFTAFHKIFFTNDDWILYSSDALIQLLPFYFWMVSAILILLFFAISLGLISYFSRKLINRQNA